ncbi:MAG: CPBP family intramembrane metalloprotease [Deltaproteobacteria bacterium]|nr:MAG: CPBP family intramembrane metalloprotease [Deltaproteobacteria bacterium]
MSTGSPSAAHDRPAPILVPLTEDPRPTLPIGLVTVVYGVMAAGSVAWSVLVQDRHPLLLGDGQGTGWWVGVLIGLLLGAVTVMLSRVGERHLRSLERLSRFLREAVRGLSPVALVWLGVLSATAEELLFRGVLLESMGLLGSSLLFAVVHIGPRGARLAWMIFALIMGLLLGLLTHYTGSLLGAVVAHAFINTINLLRLGARPIPAADAADLH